MSESPPRAPAGQAAAAAVERWALPTVEGPLAGFREERSGGDRREGLAAQEAARGYQAGLTRARNETQAQLQELEARVRQLDTVLQHLAQPLKSLDAEVEKELMQLALAVGEQLARRELQIDPAQVVAIVRQCLEQLPLSAREIRVHLHPQDAACVRERLTSPGGERAWSLVEDPTLSRGGCVVRSDSSQIDARLRSRLSAIAASALGEVRTSERASPASDAPSDEDGAPE
jgi:flagellar assembly protein FliH